MKIYTVCQQYFNGPKELLSFKQNSGKKNLIACVKTLSYLIVPISLPVGIAYGISAAYRYFNHKRKPETKLEGKTGLQGKKHLQKPVNNRTNFHWKSQPRDASNVGPTTPIDSTKAPRETSLIPYPGDLDAAHKLEYFENPAIKFGFVADDHTWLDLKCNEAPNIHISIRRQNIFLSAAEVIVNAANDRLQGGGGIDGAVNKEGGPEYSKMQQGLRSIPEYKNGYITGHACMIESGNIKAKHQTGNIIVVAGPDMNGIGAGIDLKPFESQLYSCYYNSLVLAHNQGKKSIAFPAISTGIFAFPKDRAAEISLRAIHDFASNYKGTSLTQISIHFLPSDPESDLKNYRDIAK